MPKRIPVHRPLAHQRVRPIEQHLVARRGSAHTRGYTKRWARYSKLRLQQYPHCVRCMMAGLVVLATQTDHIIPVEGPEDPRFWDPTNHQSLCTPCHSAKTAAEDGGYGNRKREVVHSAHANGWGKGGSKVKAKDSETDRKSVV